MYILYSVESQSSHVRTEPRLRRLTGRVRAQALAHTLASVAMHRYSERNTKVTSTSSLSISYTYIDIYSIPTYLTQSLPSVHRLASQGLPTKTQRLKDTETQRHRDAKSDGSQRAVRHGRRGPVPACAPGRDGDDARYDVGTVARYQSGVVLRSQGE